MKKYPYTESTDLIIYDQKPKKEKKQKVWLTAVCSALAASIFTAGVFGTGMYFMQKNMNNNTQSAAVASATTQSESSSILAFLVRMQGVIVRFTHSSV